MTTLFEMIDALNEAETIDAYREADLRLAGWIDCANEHGIKLSGIECDMHSMKKYGDVPMTCGILFRNWTA